MCAHSSWLSISIHDTCIWSVTVKMMCLVSHPISCVHMLRDSISMWLIDMCAAWVSEWADMDMCVEWVSRSDDMCEWVSTSHVMDVCVEWVCGNDAMGMAITSWLTDSISCMHQSCHAHQRTTQCTTTYTHMLRGSIWWSCTSIGIQM